MTQIFPSHPHQTLVAASEGNIVRYMSFDMSGMKVNKLKQLRYSKNKLSLPNQSQLNLL
jgi:hypothetical protein